MNVSKSVVLYPIRRSAVLSLVVILPCLSFYSCKGVERAVGSKGEIVLVLVDVSGSIPAQDWEIYEKTFEALLSSRKDAVRPGNRVVLARISGQTLSNFIPDADVVFPKTGIRLNDEESAERIVTELREDFRNLRKKNADARFTNIFESLKIAADVFRRDKERSVRRIVILSDMVEESSEYQFTKNPPTELVTEEIIEEHKAAGILPGLAGVTIYVAGAGGGKNYETIKKFWLRYFEEAGATCDESTYGRSAITTF